MTESLHQQFYFYLADTRRLLFVQLDEHALLEEQHLHVGTDVATGDMVSMWVCVQKYAGIPDKEIAGIKDHVAVLSALQRNESINDINGERLKVAVRALECIYRFTTDNYARDALKELQNSGWPVDWEGGKPVAQRKTVPRAVRAIDGVHVSEGLLPTDRIPDFVKVLSSMVEQVERKTVLMLATMNLAKDEMWCCGISFRCGSKLVEGKPLATARFLVLWNDTLIAEVFNSAATPVIDWQNESVSLTGPGVLTLQAIPVGGDSGLLFGEFR